MKEPFVKLLDSMGQEFQQRNFNFSALQRLGSQLEDLKNGSWNNWRLALSQWCWPLAETCNGAEAETHVRPLHIPGHPQIVVAGFHGWGNRERDRKIVIETDRDKDRETEREKDKETEMVNNVEQICPSWFVSFWSDIISPHCPR